VAIQVLGDNAIKILRPINGFSRFFMVWAT